MQCVEKLQHMHVGVCNHLYLMVSLVMAVGGHAGVKRADEHSCVAACRRFV